MADFDLIYAGAQKNLGPAGATLYIVKDGVTMKLNSEEIKQVAKAFPETVGGRY